MTDLLGPRTSPLLPQQTGTTPQEFREQGEGSGFHCERSDLVVRHELLRRASRACNDGEGGHSIIDGRLRPFCGCCRRRRAELMDQKHGAGGTWRRRLHGGGEGSTAAAPVCAVDA